MGGYFDMHCHIIPEVDDGSDSIEESLAILEMEVRAGVSDIILVTPARTSVSSMASDSSSTSEPSSTSGMI